MHRVAVNSSNIKSIGYDPVMAILEVEFILGDMYQYYDVPRRLHEEIMHASSIGGFLNDNIVKYNYRYRKMN